MAKVRQQRINGSLLIHVVRSFDHPEEAALCLTPGVPVRIHNANGGYLFTLEAGADGLVRRYEDGAFLEREPGVRFNEHTFGVDDFVRPPVESQR